MWNVVRRGVVRYWGGREGRAGFGICRSDMRLVESARVACGCATRGYRVRGRGRNLGGLGRLESEVWAGVDDLSGEACHPDADG